MKILRILNRFNLGGPTYNAAYLSKHLGSEYETLLVAGMRDDTEEGSEHILEQVGVEGHYIKDMRREISPAADYKALQSIDKLIKNYKPDIVHTHAAKAGMLGRLAAIRNNVPIIVHTFHGHVFHSYFSPVKTRLFIGLERYLASKSNAIVAVSDIQKNELANIYKIAAENKIYTIPLGFDLSRFNDNKEEKRKRFRDKYQLSADEIAVGIVGRLVPIKNHHLFIDIVNNIHSTHKNVRFFIIGDGELKAELTSQATQLGIDWVYFTDTQRKATLTFTSWIKDMDDAYAGLDIVTLTSFNEGTPVTLIEAQAAGKPIVTTNVGGVKNTVSEGNTAIVVDSDNMLEFSNALKVLCDDFSERERMAANGWSTVEDRFHYTRLVRDMRNLYADLIEKQENFRVK